MSSFLLQEDDGGPGKVCVVCDCLFLGMSSVFLFLRLHIMSAKTCVDTTQRWRRLRPQSRRNLPLPSILCESGPLILSSQFSAMGKQTKKKKTLLHNVPYKTSQPVSADSGTTCDSVCNERQHVCVAIVAFLTDKRHAGDKYCVRFQKHRIPTSQVARTDRGSATGERGEYLCSCQTIIVKHPPDLHLLLPLTSTWRWLRRPPSAVCL